MGLRWTGLLVGAALLGAVAPAALASPSPKIVGGGTTTIGTYPWQVALDYNDPMGDDFDNQFCGGSLLTTRIVQTAAHCIHDGDPDCSDPTCNGGADDPTGDGTDALDPNDMYVVKGATTLSTATAANEVNVQAIYEDAGYDDSTTQNDFAWVVLDTGVPLNANVKTIQVAAPSEASVWDTNSPTQVSGWGDTCDGCNAPPDDLKSAVVPRVADGDCADPLSYGTEFFPAVMVCAGYLAGGTDACFGDSGGPLVGPATVASKTRLVGVVSFGDGCAKVNKPTVYSRIADYPGGIQSVIDFIEAPAQENLPDGGSVVGDGTAVGVANGPGQSLIRPPPAATPAAAAASAPAPKCKKKKKKKHKKKKCKR